MKIDLTVFMRTYKRLDSPGKRFDSRYEVAISSFGRASEALSRVANERLKEKLNTILIRSDAIICAAMYKESEAFRIEFDQLFGHSEIDEKKLVELRAIALQLKKSKENED